ncbi:ATP-binding protein [Streptomyces graminilatus]|uniref:ATP-binding protein n=1 Tax=Streptomyces graminilatus TaxID=1464070 RepID=UPI00099E9CC7|nr:ATP-binding protein [Streptomyces graminilatus]
MNETTQPCTLRERFFRRERRSVPAARRLAYEFLAGWGLAGTERGDDVLLCVSELVTNALLHGVPPGRQFKLFLRYDGQVLRVAVHDSGPGDPSMAEQVDESHEGGRGLLLVSALSDKWGVGERGLGKVVWCDWDLPIDVLVPVAGEAFSPSASRSR